VINRLELRRQLFHLTLGIFFIALFYFGLLSVRALFVILITGLFLAIVSTKLDIPGVAWFLEKFDRKDARFPGEGAFFYVLGCFIVLGVFPRDIAFGAIMVLAAGDSFATLVGSSVGKQRIGKKTAEGLLAGIIAGFVGALFFVDAVAAFIGSIAAMLTETLEIRFFGKSVDDNLFVPVIAAIVMYGVVQL